MFVKYGGYTHADNEVALVITKQAEHSSNGILTGVRERWNLQGRLQADGAAAITAAINALEAAYADDGKDLELLTSPDQGPTSHRIISVETNSGTLVTTRPSFPSSAGAEYATIRDYNIVVEALLKSGFNDVVSWTETINIRGTGGPVWGYLQSINAAPIAQTFAQASPITITQRGEAVKMGGYPVPPEPVELQQEHQERRDITRHLPADNSQRRRTSWSYVMEVLSHTGPNPTPFQIDA